MQFDWDEKTEKLRHTLLEFMDSHVYPAEKILHEQTAAAADPYTFEAPIKDEVKAAARELGLWNLFLPDEQWGAGLTNLQYAPLAEITGRCPTLAPEAINCSAPDTGNIELLALFATPDQQEQWLRPLLGGLIRSSFSMTEPAVASSDATNIATTIERDGDEYVINGHKWWTSGAMRERCKLLIVMGVTNPDANRHERQSMILVPRDAPGISVRRSTTVFGYHDHTYGGHAEIVYDNVRVPVENLLGVPGGGFAMAQARLGPGRIHHCMRLIGQAEYALEVMCRRSRDRVAFGKPLAGQGVVQESIADSRIEIEQARLLVLKTAWLMDTVGNKGARTEIAAIKVAVPSMAARVIDRAIQICGGAGLSEDFRLAGFYSEARLLRIGDGPDEVHRRTVARQELNKYDPALN